MIDLSDNLKDSSFIRKVIVSVLGYYVDNIKNTVVEDGKIVEKHIPFNLSKNGDIQYIEDVFFDKEVKECNGVKINGDINQIPSGILSINDFSVDDTSALNTNNAAIYNELKKGDFFDEHKKRYTRVDIIPLIFSGVLKIRASSLLSSFIITENIIDLHYKTRHIIFSHNGFEKIPLAIEIGNKSISSNRKIGYKLSESNDRYVEIEFPITIAAWYLIKNRVVDYGNTIKEITQTLNVDDK